MPAFMPKTRSAFICCLQESSALFAGPKPSRALAMIALLTVLLAAATISAQKHRIQLEDLTKIVTVSDPQISPDGKSIVCGVSRQNFDEDRSDRELVLVDVATGAQRVLTFGRKGWGLRGGLPAATGWPSWRSCLTRPTRTTRTTPPKEKIARRFSSCR